MEQSDDSQNPLSTNIDCNPERTEMCQNHPLRCLCKREKVL